jgi:MFS family permease
MTRQERQGWIIVASLFVTLLLVFGGGYNTFGVFFTPLLNHFKWDRAKLSTLQSALAISAGFSAPLVGWLLDRVEARVVMVAGAVCAGLAFLAASQADSYPWLVGCYLLLGTGIGGATLLPCSMVVANWFTERRGFAMGLTFAGTSIGGMIMTLVAGYAIAWKGWRAGYLVLGLPMLLVVIPVVLLLVRTRPRTGEERVSMLDETKSLPGLEVAGALRARSFWLIAIAQFCFSFAAAGAVAHLVTYLIGIGYAATRAALVMGLVFGLTSLGKLAMGSFADRVSGRVALAVNFLVASAGFLMVLGAESSTMLVGFVLVFGLTLGAPLVLMPMLLVESLGLKRFGTIAGMTGVCGTLGAATGPVVAGHIYDVSGSYTHAFLLFVAMLLIGAAASYTCLGLAAEQARAERLGVAAAQQG